MRQLEYTNGKYHTEVRSVSLFAKHFPSLAFYSRFLGIVFRSSSKAKHGQYDDEAWSDSSLDVLRALEYAGVSFNIRGITSVRNLQGPCVFVANHMSMLETMILPIIIEPEKNVTFVIKQSLLEYPVFKHVMRSRDPIAVTRKHPRDDFKAVLEGGLERLRDGRSIIIFPQTTRMHSFDPAQFNTIGIKLAKKANVPVVPIALITDAWNNGAILKDFGKIDPAKQVLFAFGQPLWVEGRGDEEHARIVEFIQTNVGQKSLQEGDHIV